MATSSAQYLDHDKSVVALHACGELHVHLLRQASQQGCRHLAVAPCCYNRIPGEHYQPLSTAAALATATEHDRPRPAIE